MSSETTKSRHEVLQIRLTAQYLTTLKQLQVSVLLAETKGIKDTNKRNIRMLELAKNAKFSLSGVARAYLVKAVEEWLPHEIYK
jgi:hypothetical protein